MVSLVTPGAVAPPLLPPFHGSTHGGAYPLGTATFPVDVSHPGPQSTCLPCAFASSKVNGAGPCRDGAGLAAVSDDATSAHPSASASGTKSGREGRTGGDRRASGRSGPVSTLIYPHDGRF